MNKKKSKKETPGTKLRLLPSAETRVSCSLDLEHLSFSDLIDASHLTIDRLKKGEDSENQARLLMAEFARRLKGESRCLSQTVLELKKRIGDD